MKIKITVGLCILLFSFGLQIAGAATMNDYCVTPPYIGAAIEPNLLLFIDNSASMYDLNYTDTKNTYCRNAPTKSCSTDTDCAALSTTLYPAYCVLSATPATSTTYTLKPCTTDSNCPNSTGLNPCQSNGFCRTCNTITGSGDCVASTTTTYAPIQCNDINTSTDGGKTFTGPSCNSITSGDTCGNQCSLTHTCYDDTYNNAGSYDGLFDQNSYYYNYPAVYANPNTGGLGPDDWFWANYNFFIASLMPSSCTYGGSGSNTPFVCINLDASGKLSSFVASGKFLNWLAMSKFDIEKKILTGGKLVKNPYDYLMLEADTRGCSGRKFIKVVPGLVPNGCTNNCTGLTFAIRGGSATGINIESQAAEWGQTYLEIYQGSYNAADCMAAMNDWTTNANLGTTQKDTSNCIGGSQQNPALIAANQTIHDCFWYFNTHSLSNLVPIKNDCVQDWSSQPLPCTTDADCAICPAGNSCNLVSGDTCSTKKQCKNSTYFIQPSSITKASPDAICSSWYLGTCYNFKTGAWDDGCALNMAMDFCDNLGNASQVTDPASNTIVNPTTANVPGFVASLGLAGLPMLNDYTPYASYGGTKGFMVDNYLATAPTGIIDKYKNMIRFGVMTFQNNGSASECNSTGPIPCVSVCSNNQNKQCYKDSDCTSGTSTGTCSQLPKTDGGTVLSYVGAGTCSSSGAACVVDSDCTSVAGETCTPSVGDHYSGLIHNIDAIAATSWTPFAEAFYNAMGYYARSNDYTQGDAPTSRTEFNFSGWPAAYATNKNPSQRTCQKNVVMIVTDGMSTADSNPQVDGSGGLVKAYAPLVSDVINGVTYAGVYGYDTTNLCPGYEGSRSLPVLTWAANHRNIKNLSLTDPTLKHCSNNIFGPSCSSDSECTPGICTNQPIHSSESVQTYVVYTGGQTSFEPGLCDPKTLMTAAAMNGGTQLFQAADVSQLSTALASAFDQVAAKASSGTAASVLATGEGSGANLIQAVFYPHKRFSWCSNAVGTACTQDSDCGSGNTCVNNVEISWIGRLTNLWYYVDPFAKTSSIREDNGTTGSSWPAGKTPGNGDKIMDLVTTASSPSDYIVQMYYDRSLGVTKVYRMQDPAGNGVVGSAMPTINFEDIGSLWEAGTMLWKRNLSTSPRNIKTTIDGVNLVDFLTSTPSLTSYLNTTDASNLISWVTGSDVSGYRSRTVMMPNTDNIARVWKLGDIVNSTPRILSWSALNNYYAKYNDSTYGNTGSLNDPVDSSHFVTTAAYKKRGMVFAGGNDGMLHAFKLGTLQLSWSGQGATQKARLVNPDTGNVCKSTDTTPCGQEVWAFIPKNALPYLKYMADQAYCHVNSIDLTPFIFDASIGGSSSLPNDQKTVASWRTVLIGGMRFGGACKALSDACTTPNCVKTPISGVGYSSYFALDITDPNNPKLLWEFSDPRLGFASTGPAIIRINGDGTSLNIRNEDTNGNWFVVIGSGPTGPISTTDHQFLGGSDQSLKIFILDLRTGKLLNDGAPNFDTGIANAFAGSLEGGAVDWNYDYQDDLMYIPYVKKASDGTWTDGGVLRLVTKNDPTPTNWTWSTLIDNVGPVTASVAKIYDKTAMNLWAYFGTGRYYYVQNTASDDPKGIRRLFGIKDPCMKSTGYDFTCTDPADFSKLTDVTDINDAKAVTVSGTADGSKFFGWYISLDPDGLYTYPPDPETNFMAERDIANPLATSSGVVYFTSYKPYTDLCLFGGKSFIWTLKYNTGDFPNVTGLALVQTSTGAIEQLPIKDRKSSALEGLPNGSPTMQKPPAAANRFIHMRER